MILLKSIEKIILLIYNLEMLKLMKIIMILMIKNKNLHKVLVY